jgi:hypothetical protein
VTGQPQWQDFATQYAGQTPPPQQVPPGQTPPPQNQPTQGWQGGGAPVGYPPYQQGQQPYQTGPIPPYQTGPMQPVQGYPQYPGQPLGPTAQGVWQPPQQPPQPKKSRGALVGVIAATVAVAVVVVGAVYFFALKKNNGPANPSTTITVTTPGSPSTNPTTPANNNSPSDGGGPTAQGEATAINNLLVSSAQARSQWDAQTLVNNTGNCVNIDQDVTQIGDIANSRSSELNQVQTLQFDKLPNGATLKSQLMSALQVSLQIDNDYLNWAKQQQSSSCSYGFNNTYYNNATAEDNTATNDKQAFLNNWDPIASQYGLEQFSAGQI